MDGFLFYDDVEKHFAVQPLIAGVITDDVSVRVLHDGDGLTIQVKRDNWRVTRMEKDSDDELYGWYFVGVGRAAPMIGHSVRID